jgi:hypothetical protein
MLERLSVEDSQVLRAWITVLMFFTALGGHAVGQSLATLPPGIPPIQDELAKRHMSPLGKPCLVIQGYAKPEMTNKNIYQHSIRVANNCGKDIKVQACYYKTEDCVVITVPPWGSKISVLGIFPALKRFQFEAKEQF